MKKVITAVILLALLVVLSGCDQQERKSKHYSAKSPFTAQEFGEKEMKLPSFELLSARDGVPMSSSIFDGKVLLITFFASWCGSCREELDDLKKIQDRYGKQNLNVIAISADKDDPKRLKKLSEKAEINYPILMGNKEVAQQFGGISTVPVTFLFNRSGYLTKKYFSHINQNILVNDIEKLLTLTRSNR